MRRRMNEAYSSFSTGRRRRLGVNVVLTLDRPPRSPALDGWSAVLGVIACSFRPGLAGIDPPSQRVIGGQGD
jgi:hypothetical protein